MLLITITTLFLWLFTTDYFVSGSLKLNRECVCFQFESQFESRPRACANVFCTGNTR